MIIDSLLDALQDSMKLVPFLLLTYFIMEGLEHHTGGKAQQRIRKAGNLGPLWGGVLGILPQCGFSAAASSLYAGRVITIGTLFRYICPHLTKCCPFSVREVPMETIFKILAVKVVIAVISGFAVEFAYLHLIHHREKDLDIHTVCEEEHCSCEDGVLQSAMKHTIKIFFFIFLISAALNLLIGFVGEESIAAVFQSTPIVGEAVAALVGLIP